MNTNTQGRGEIVLYQTADGRTSIDVKLENETVWLTQAQMAVSSVLKDYLIKGYAVRNDLAQQKYDDLKQLVDVMGRVYRSISSMILEATSSGLSARSCP